MAVSSKSDVLERVKSFVFHLNEPMKLDDYQMAQNNLQQQWNTAPGGKMIYKWSQLFSFILICGMFSEFSLQIALNSTLSSLYHHLF